MFVIAEAIIERRSGAFEPAGPSTALAFNMHASIVMPLLESPVTLIEACTVQAADKELRGATMGLHSMCGYAGGFVGPLGVGLVLDRVGSSQGWVLPSAISR